jgi:hypothetical protein
MGAAELAGEGAPTPPRRPLCGVAPARGRLGSEALLRGLGREALTAGGRGVRRRVVHVRVG